MEKYHIIKEPILGRGSYGIVYKCYKSTDKFSRKPFAAKKISTDEDFAKINSELQALRRLKSHPNIVEFIEIEKRKSNYYIIMEYCDRGDLVKYIQDKNPTMDAKLNIMTQCASAVEFMHKQNPPVVHRDLKPQNILMTHNIIRGDVAKVTDFGLAKLLKPDQLYMQTDVGSPAFRAPELFDTQQDLHYTREIDNFSLGLVFMALVNYPKYKDNFLLPAPDSLFDKPFLPYGQRLLLGLDSEVPLFELGSTESPEEDTKRLIMSMTQKNATYRLPMEIVLAELVRIKDKYFPTRKGYTSKVSFLKADSEKSQSLRVERKDVMTGVKHTALGRVSRQRNSNSLSESKPDDISATKPRRAKSAPRKQLVGRKQSDSRDDPEQDLNAVNVGLPKNPETLSSDFENLCEAEWRSVIDLEGEWKAQSIILSTILQILYKEALGTYGVLLQQLNMMKCGDDNFVISLCGLLGKINNRIIRKFQEMEKEYQKYREVIDLIMDPFKTENQESSVQVDNDLENELRRYLLTYGEKTKLHTYGDPAALLEKVEANLNLFTTPSKSISLELGKIKTSSKWPPFCERAARLMWYMVLQKPVVYIETTHLGDRWCPEYEEFITRESDSDRGGETSILFYTRPVLYRSVDNHETKVLKKGRAVVKTDSNV